MDTESDKCDPRLTRHGMDSKISECYLRLRLDLLDTSGSEQFPAMRRVAILSGSRLFDVSMLFNMQNWIWKCQEVIIMHKVAIRCGWFCIPSGHAFLLVYSLGCSASLEVTSWLQGLKRDLWNCLTELFPPALCESLETGQKTEGNLFCVLMKSCTPFIKGPFWFHFNCARTS